MSTLYQLTTEYQNLLDFASSDDPEDIKCFLDTLESMDFEIGLKADDYAAVVRHLESQTASIDNEITRLKNRSTVIENNIKRIKSRLKTSMEAMGKKEIKTDLNTFKIVNNGGKLPLKITGEVPDKYQKVIYEVDTELIRADLDAGKVLPFAHYEERGTHLRIK